MCLDPWSTSRAPMSSWIVPPGPSPNGMLVTGAQPRDGGVALWMKPSPPKAGGVTLLTRVYHRFPSRGSKATPRPFSVNGGMQVGPATTGPVPAGPMLYSRIRAPDPVARGRVQLDHHLRGALGYVVSLDDERRRNGCNDETGRIPVDEGPVHRGEVAGLSHGNPRGQNRGQDRHRP